MRLPISLLAGLLAFGCHEAPAGGYDHADSTPYVVPAALEARVKSGELTEAFFAGGCFWCVESSLEAVPGVVDVISGYAGGGRDKPSYKEVGGGGTGHAESVRVLYDPKKLPYDKLLEAFWRNIDPTQPDGQFCDLGNQYRSVIFYRNEAEKAAAERTKAELEKGGKLPGPIVTQIVPATPFWPAETYHQDFYKKNPEHYHAYREGCGRDRRLLQLWGAMSPASPH